MSCRCGGDLAVRRHEGEEEEELFKTSSCASSGGESGDDEDRFPDGGAEEGGGEQDRRRSAPPQPLRRMNSDSVYDMSGMTAQLPAKKGLSMYYQGKSQSFSCISEVRSLEDLQKKEKSRSQKIKSCKSYVALGGIAKKPASSCANLSLMAGNSYRAPRIPVNENCYHQ